MKYATVDLQGYKYVKTTFSYADDKTIVDAVIEKAVRLSGTVNPHSPDGKLRPQNTRFHKLLGGLLAETAVLEYLSEQSKIHGKEMEVVESSLNQEEDLSRLGFNQVDVKLQIAGKELDIEIRSSFSYRTSLNRLFGVPLIDGKGAFSIIGWYTSSNKPGEVKKDYYVFAIHYYEPSEIENRIYDSVDVYIAGAASRQTLEESGEYSSLKQNGAKFRIINPLNSTNDPVDVISEILG